MSSHQRRTKRRIKDRIRKGIFRVHAENVSQMVADPNGPYPACKSAPFTMTCARCGRDMRAPSNDACASVPKENRWRINYAA